MTTLSQATFSARRSLAAHLRELWGYRDLIYNLVVRDLKVRYKYSVLGILWSLLNPLLMMLIFAVVFTVVLRQDIKHFSVFFLTGLLPWNFFQASLMGATGTIVGNSGLIKKVYFPREVLPISLVLSNLVNFGLALLVLGGFLVATGIGFTPYMLWLPIIILIQLLFVIGLGLFTSALNVFYRDTLMILDVALQAWFFLTPIFYPMGLIPQTVSVWGILVPVHRLMRWTNPMASIVDTYRTVLYGVIETQGRQTIYYPPSPPALDFLLRTGLTALLIFAFGWWFFRRLSPRFGEEV